MADILIRGMEMPLGKTELIVFPSGVVQVYDSRENYLGKAKAVPLPEGHGDLIDRDAFRADNGLGKDCENCDRNTRNCNYDICLSRMDVSAVGLTMLLLSCQRKEGRTNVPKTDSPHPKAQILQGKSLVLPGLYLP